ncbi:receptor-type tyrosine-protein phosphatase kappa-like [Athalia rosae]|uniref:receptor-type tyrosine-protein phosphatase kappa-like n=1 Tax=Athalia rosae TaxID=37344 RepID=UPI002033AF04|nr:receptor-type tyrosine-protein phosphatase kappa-like [Athalia rosae]
MSDDRTRVRLEKIDEDSYSDYINANYIRGFQQNPTYIATQGPTSNTINDFWRMVWQEKTSLICMVTNLIENGEVLCEQYWPEVQKRFKYEFVVVLNAGEVKFDDYVLRTFHVQCGVETREVTHLHYTGAWPNKGVLTCSSSLVSYLERLLAIPTEEGLVVVHGSLGVGRTGVVILCDVCLRRALHDKIINVPAVTIRMREDRGNMVESEHYYLLAHILISGYLREAETQDQFYTEIPY